MSLRIGLMLAVLASCGLLVGHVEAKPSITWSIVNRNRLLAGEPEEQRYLLTLRNYMSRAGHATSCDPRRELNEKPQKSGDLAKCNFRSQYPAPTNRTFRTHWSPVDHAYDRGYVQADRSQEARTLRLGLTAPSSRERKGIAKATCDWWIDGAKKGVGASCDTYFARVALGDHQIAVDILKDGQPASHVPDTGADTISVNDYLIAVMGDSFGSGEGNPATFIVDKNSGYLRNRPALWLEPRCHRSLFSSSGILAAMLAEKFPHSSFTLATFACSGAETGEGILKPYYGRETTAQTWEQWWRTGANMQTATDAERFKGFRDDMAGKPARMNNQGAPAPRDIPSQIDQLQALLCKPGGACRRPDAIVIYVGVNDIGFTKIVTKLVTGCRPKDCAAAVGTAIKDGLRTISNNLSTLDAQLQKRGILPASRKNVLVVTYPNPLTYPDGKRHAFCDWRKARIAGGENFLGVAGTLLAIGIKQASAQWANDSVLEPLNAMLRQSAGRLGWDTVETQDISIDHGFCAPKRWFQTYTESNLKQGNLPDDFVPDSDGKGQKAGGIPTGAMHPNIFGHVNVQSRISKKVQVLFGLDLKP